MATLFKMVNGELIEMTIDETTAHIHTQEILAVEAQAQLYIDRRLAEYPAIGDQLDVIWKWLGSQKLDNETKMMYNMISEIKAKYPK